MMRAFPSLLMKTGARVHRGQRGPLVRYRAGHTRVAAASVAGRLGPISANWAKVHRCYIEMGRWLYS